VIATRPRSKDVPRRSTVFDIIKNWTIKLRKPADKLRYDGILFILFFTMNCDKLTYICKLHWLQNIIYIFNKIVIINSLTTNKVCISVLCSTLYTCPQTLFFVRRMKLLISYFMENIHQNQIQAKRGNAMYIIFNNIQAMN